MAKQEPNEVDIQKHIEEEHQLSPFSEYLREIVYGGIDGIVTTFAVVAGFSGAELGGSMMSIPLLSVLLFGFANLFADASSMALGNVLSVRSDQDVYKKEQEKERKEINNSPEFEKAETIHLFELKGFTKSQAQELTKIYMSNKSCWVEFMMRNELQMPNPLKENPFITGITTFMSFIFFGMIPLLPYIFLRSAVSQLFEYSIIFTCLALLLLGFFRWRITGQRMFKSMFETLLLGAVSAIIAYAVGSLFRL